MSNEKKRCAAAKNAHSTPDIAKTSAKTRPSVFIAAMAPMQKHIIAKVIFLWRSKANYLPKAGSADFIGHSRAAENMEVQMLDSLPAVLADIRDDSIAVFKSEH